MAEPITCDCGPAEPFDLAAWWRVGVGILIAGNSMTVSLAVNTSEIAPQEAAVVHAVLGGLAALSLALLGLPLIRNTWAAVRSRRITLEGLFVSGVIGAFTASAVAALTGRGDVYFEIVSILLVVYAFGQQVTTGAQEHALSATRAWAPEHTTCTRLRDDGSAETVGLTEIRPGDRVRIDPGESIPVDGVIDEGTAWIREAEMTGEGFAVVRRPGDPVWAGTHSLDAGIVVRATSAAGERRIDAIVDAVERARTQPTSWQHRADRLVAVFLPVVLTISAATFTVWTLLDHWTTGLFNAMAVLLVACPCALGLATPLAAWAALGRLAGRGLIAKSGAVIEALNDVDVAVFDKTGTLTTPTLSLLDLVTAGGDEDRREVRGAVQVLEQASGHPIATAFRDLVPDPAGQVSDTRVLPGVGFSGRVRLPGGGPKTWTVGDPEGLGVAGDAGWEDLVRTLNAPAGARRLAVLRGGRPVAAAAIDEHRRVGMAEALVELNQLGMISEVFTGDRAERARDIDVDRILANLDPDDKLHEVRGRREAGLRILYVGDGVNDAAAMAAADVGIAVAEGTDLALEAADISWHGGDLRTIPWAVSLARRTVGTIRSNLVIALTYNAVGISLAVAGILHPVAATILMTCSSLIVTWRATGVLADDQQEAESALAAPIADHLVGETR
ncbi:MAG: heavy metal translocating P-type ATPase [Thermoanaerobaculales bacterium]|jgi:heavy metal translocating P-type ATPase|nr:heavy metal translocating P-type ATPase [Thermoanaerobaculales bacterium]